MSNLIELAAERLMEVEPEIRAALEQGLTKRTRG
jgi:hypothetical protein